MKKFKFGAGVMAAALWGMANVAGAAITAPVTLDFQEIGVQTLLAGAANTAPLAGGACTGGGPGSGCYYEGEFAVGIVQDRENPFAHVHRGGSAANRAINYHSDAAGLYVRALDGSAFSLISLDLLAALDDIENPDSGADDVWEILGFNTATNPDLDIGNGTDYATRVAYQTVANGFNGTLTLNDDFRNINAFWIHYKGYPATPLDGKTFAMTLDNVQLGAAVPQPVPLPATGWLFLLSGMVTTKLARRAGQQPATAC